MTDLYYGMPPGILLRRTFLTIASVTSRTFVTGRFTNFLKVILVGGGGAGGGVAATTTNVAVGGGGGSGSWVEFAGLSSEFQTYSYAVGLPGTGVVNGQGGNGGTTSFPFSVIQAFGGQGGDPGVAGTLITRGGVSLGTIVGTPILNIAVPSIVAVTGQPGGYGMGMSAGTVAARGGKGADTPWGIGSWDVIANNSQRGSGVSQLVGQYGCGGCGAANSGTQTTQAGSDGAQGLIIVEEYT